MNDSFTFKRLFCYDSKGFWVVGISLLIAGPLFAAGSTAPTHTTTPMNFSYLANKGNAGIFNEYHYVIGATAVPSPLCGSGGTVFGAVTQAVSTPSPIYIYQCEIPFSHEDLASNTTYLNEKGTWYQVSSSPNSDYAIIYSGSSVYPTINFVTSNNAYITSPSGAYVLWATSSNGGQVQLNTGTANVSSTNATMTAFYAQTAIPTTVTITKTVTSTLSSGTSVYVCSGTLAITAANLNTWTNQTVYVDCCPTGSVADKHNNVGTFTYSGTIKTSTTDSTAKLCP